MIERGALVGVVIVDHDRVGVGRVREPRGQRAERSQARGARHQRVERRVGERGLDQAQPVTDGGAVAVQARDQRPELRVPRARDVDPDRARGADGGGEDAELGSG